jgi:hypothetical protein
VSQISASVSKTINSGLPTRYQGVK